MAGGIAKMKHRPVEVTVVAAFLSLAAGVALVTGISLLFPNPIWNIMWDLNRPAYNAFERLGRPSGGLLLALGITTGAAATGLMLQRKWAWWLAIALFAINGLGDLVSLFLTRDLVKGGMGVFVASVFLFFLTRSGVKRSFR
jgi:hypothetical protein